MGGRNNDQSHGWSTSALTTGVGWWSRKSQSVLFEANKSNEFQKYLTLDGHVLWNRFLANEWRLFNHWSDADRAIIRTAHESSRNIRPCRTAIQLWRINKSFWLKMAWIITQQRKAKWRSSVMLHNQPWSNGLRGSTTRVDWIVLQLSCKGC